MVYDEFIGGIYHMLSDTLTCHWPIDFSSNELAPISQYFQAIVSCMVLGALAHRAFKTKSHNHADILRCPNPGCVRCQRYEETNKNAKRRLEHRIRTKSGQDRISERIVQGITSGVPQPDSFVIEGQYPNVLLVPGLAVKPIASDMHNKAIERLSGNDVSTRQLHDVFLQEFLSAQCQGELRNNDIGKSNPKYTDQLWQVLYLINQGEWVKQNVRLCPQTVAVVKSLEGIMEGSLFGNVFFSVLYPGTVLDAHCGPTNVRHRLHFPLSIPLKKRASHNPIFDVNGVKLRWEEGNPFVFDDSLVHSAEYLGDSQDSEIRIVLVVDLWHPHLSSFERGLLKEFYPPYGENTSND